MDIMEEIRKLYALLPGPEPRAHQLRAGIGAAPLLPRALGARKIEKPLGDDRVAGIPIIRDYDLPRERGKIVDQYGDTMTSGELTVEFDR